MPILRGGALLLVVVLLAACGPPDETELAYSEDESLFDQSSSAIRNGSTVNAVHALRLGVVQILEPLGNSEFGICSGTLVTPWWVLTAGHCLITTSATVILGNSFGSPTAMVADFDPHPSFSDSAFVLCDSFDAGLVRLQTPIWPQRDDGTVWEGYRRDLYRGSYPALTNTNFDVYGYGEDNGGDSGTLRFSPFKFHELESDHLELNEIDDESTRDGDSGGPYFTPSTGAPGANESYRIAAVHNCAYPQDPFDNTYEGTRGDDIAAWFDSTLATGWKQFDAPAQTIAVISIHNQY